MSVQPSSYRPQLPPREKWGRTASGQGRPALARPIGRPLAWFATDLRSNAPDALLMSVLREFGSVRSVWVERLRGLGATQPSGPFDQTDLGFNALDQPGYKCDVPEQARGRTSQRVAGRPELGRPA